MRVMVVVKANKDTEAGVMPEAEDFGAEFTPELREQEERLRAQSERLRRTGKS